ncbi:MAG: sensor histidine kinase [Spirochaetes bacterium]|nr:sensor histidine kinase [Spirochaetota bacterium]
MRKTKSLRSELLISFIVVELVSLLLVGGISYLWIEDLLNRRISESTVETLKQIDRNISALFGDIDDISLYTISNRYVRTFLKLNKDEEKKVAQTLININEEYANLMNSKNYVTSVNIVGDNGLTYETAVPKYASSTKEMIKYTDHLPGDGSFVITPTYVKQYQNLGLRYIISFCRQINDINNLNKRLGLLSIDISEKRLSEIYSDVQLGNTGFIFIVNREGTIVSHPRKDELCKYVGDQPYFQEVFKKGKGYSRLRIDGKDMLVTFYCSPRYNLAFIGMVPFAELMQETVSIRNVLAFMALIVSVFAFFVFFRIAKGITNPINLIIERMKKVENGDMNVVVDIQRNDEIGLLGKNFNNMIKRLKYLIEEVYKAQIKNKEAELRALQAQINPHFLYNTLDVIYWTSRLEKAEKTGSLVTALAKLFRLGLNNGNEITTIEKEVEHLKSYLAIQKVRYDQEPKIILDVDMSIFEYKTIKLILQPVVENALIHGIADLGEESIVEVTGREQDGDIVFTILDNGVGMSNEKIASIFLNDSSAKKGYGIKNVHERIKLLFGEKYGMTIASKEGEGTKVEIRIPKTMNIDDGGIDDKDTGR